MNKVIKKKSSGYGYEYASLADLVEQGCAMPHMKIEIEDGKQFLWFYDESLKEWLRGAEIVIPEMAKANAAQRYGAALTYAFRYVTQMFNRVATGDDALIEDIDDKGERKTAQTAEKAPKKRARTLELRPEDMGIITPELEQQMTDVAKMREMMFANRATDTQKQLIRERYSGAEIMKMLGRMKKTLDELTQDEAKKMLEARPGK